MISAYEWDKSTPFKMNVGKSNEIEYPSLKKACEILSYPNGIINYKAVWLHMDTYNLTPEEALKYFLAKREKWTHQGVWYKSAESAIDSEPECNLSPAAVLSRMRRGMTLTEALTTPRKCCGPKTGPTAKK